MSIADLTDAEWDALTGIPLVEFIIRTTEYPDVREYGRRLLSEYAMRVYGPKE